MTLAELVVETYPELNPHLVHYRKLATLFIVTYDGNAVGFYNPEEHKVTFDTVLIKPFLGG